MCEVTKDYALKTVINVLAVLLSPVQHGGAGYEQFVHFHDWKEQVYEKRPCGCTVGGEKYAHDLTF